MARWASIQYSRNGEKRGIPKRVVESALRQVKLLQAAGLPVVLTLKHLAFITGVRYRYLHKIVARRRRGYKVYHIKKRSGGQRVIYAPEKELLRVQRWIDQRILRAVPASEHSYAFNTGGSIVECARQHTECRWLIKLDLQNFFESYSEREVYKVFRGLGYAPLVSFELARLCTTVERRDSRKYRHRRWKNVRHLARLHFKSATGAARIAEIEAQNSSRGAKLPYRYEFRVGHLPQGAATSPRLSNIITRSLDNELSLLAEERGLVYTRYADDVTFSAFDPTFCKNDARAVIAAFNRILPKYHLRPNAQKSLILGPGTRRVVLGLQVDTDKVKLSKSFRDRLEVHLHFCQKDIIGHQSRRGFRTLDGLVNHIQGLIGYAAYIDEGYANKVIGKYGHPDEHVRALRQ